MHTHTYFVRKNKDENITNSMRNTNFTDSFCDFNATKKTESKYHIYTHTKTHIGYIEHKTHFLYTSKKETKIWSSMRHLNITNSISNLNTND